MTKFSKRIAFTMAEAIIVMTILGIIAAIMITNLRMPEYRDNALKVQAKKMLEQIDQATQQIILNNTRNGTLDEVYRFGTTNVVHVYGGTDVLTPYYKKYMYSVRTIVPVRNDLFIHSSSDFSKGFEIIKLKDGSCFKFVHGGGSNIQTIFPGEINTTIMLSNGYVCMDINCEDEPNKTGKDQFYIPFDKNGIKYDN